MDGVLVDSEEVSMKVGASFFREKGYDCETKDFLPHLGAGEYEFFMGVARDHGWDISYEEASRYFREHYPALISSIKAALPGGKELVRALKSAGIATAVVSSAPEWKVYENISAAGLYPEDFSLVASGKSVRRNKPFPDIYLNAAIQLGADPADCLVVEDSLNGIKAGLSAGMRVMALTTTESAATVAAAGADYIVKDLSEVPLPASVEEFSTILSDIGCDGRVIYGANYIMPKKRDRSDEDMIGEMIEAAAKTRLNAYTPYSRFKVGAALLSAATGRIYTGCNMENSSYGATICAERGAVMKAVSEEGAIGIDILVVVTDDNPPSPPCAVCRQVLSEFCRPDTSIVLADLKGNRMYYTFEGLTPYPFIFPAMRK